MVSPAFFLRVVVAGCLVASLSLVFSLTFAAMVYSGPLEAFRDSAIALALFGSVVFGIFCAMTGTLPGVWWGSQAPGIVVLSVGAGAIAREMSGAPPETVFATVAALTAISTALAGLFLLLIGAARFGQAAKFIPYPVVAGFLATAGVFLLIRSVDVMLGAPADTSTLLDVRGWSGWLPYVLLGGIGWLLERRLGAATALFLVLGAFAAAFYAYLAANGLSLEDAAAANWLLGDGLPPARPPGPIFVTSVIGDADLSLIFARGWTIAAIALLTLLGLVMNVTALELQSGLSFDVDRDIRAAGAGNLFAALGCGFAGYHSVSMYQLSRNILRDPTPLPALLAAVLLAVALMVGLTAFEFLPKALFAIVLAYLGIGFLATWVFEAWRRLPRKDFAIIATIVTVAVFVDFVSAIVVGLVLSTVLFAVAYARLDVVRSITTARIRLSSTERSEWAVRRLLEHGRETVIVELQGYLFFGTAHRIHDRIADAFGDGRGEMRRLILDFRKVSGMDVSTTFVLARVADLARKQRADVYVTGVRPDEMRRLKPMLDRKGGFRIVADLDDALCEIEEAVLAEAGARNEPLSEIGGLISEAEMRGLPLVDDVRRLEPGETLYEQGEPGISLAYLKEGRLSAWLKSEGKPEARVAGFLPGAAVGEMAFAAGNARTATITADSPATVYRITRTSLAAVAETEPDLAARFHAALARLLAERLGRTTALYFALDS